jgi:hypothetical protein
MIRVILCLLVLLGACSIAAAQDIYLDGDDPVCFGDACSPRARGVIRESSPRRVVIRQENHVTVVGSAQSDAEVMAATGVLRHQGNNCGRREGIGFSTSSADDAVRRCCYYGRYRAKEIGVARGRRGWFACIRYE